MIENTLIEMALKAREKAYAPYSNFPVGAALLTTKGNIYTGCNVENISYGLTICAERVAVTNAISAGEDEFVSIAIAGSLDEATYPCGACLQFLAEFNAKLNIYIYAGNNVIKRNLQELLPSAFKFAKNKDS